MAIFWASFFLSTVWQHPDVAASSTSTTSGSESPADCRRTLRLLRHSGRVTPRRQQCLGGDTFLYGSALGRLAQLTEGPLGSKRGLFAAPIHGSMLARIRLGDGQSKIGSNGIYRTDGFEGLHRATADEIK